MDWQALLAQYGPAGGVLLLAGSGIYQFWPTISKWFAGDTDNDAADMLAFRRLEARFVRLKCKEGTDAMKVVATHFMHSEGTDAPH